MIEKSWKLNDAIYAYTEIRGDMASWLQPRAKVSSALPRRPQGPGGKDHRTSITSTGRGSGKGKGKPRGSVKGTQKGSSVQWVREFKEGGQVRRCALRGSGESVNAGTPASSSMAVPSRDLLGLPASAKTTALRTMRTSPTKKLLLHRCHMLPLMTPVTQV